MTRTFVPGTDIPEVCFVEDVASRLLMSRRTADRLRESGRFPLRALDLPGRPRWSGYDLLAYLQGTTSGSRQFGLKGLRRVR